MGKRIRAQRKGRGSVFQALTHKSKGESLLPPLENASRGEIIDLIHNPGRGAPLAVVMADTGESFKVTAPEGIYIGQKVSINHADGVRVGDILALREIPPGTLICHVENRPLDGGSFARSSGTYAQVIGPSPGGVEVKLPSGKSKVLNPECRAMIGVVSGGGRMEKPFLKAGKKYHWLRAKAGKRMPIVRGVAMNPVDHPFGGGAHQHPGKPKTVSKHAPPGRKVGSFGARSRKDKKRKQG